ncbi:MAG: peptidoglycan DD-metalloendopeptidase family protein [Clostridiales bacterium]|nr:peptidoglycan DD-metalloendopeptidase family protein [Clostridiales bacterium]MCI2161053.1 peptidoglycan DD-metalloendopeptidase family protein [Oscillospiraceae bacterium]MCI1961584.1 peptidoglycan DD-metalloendopeptidase family protein [Clostridiales bacterium]MCI2022007.1 peptidoglycan DD-metalloendopeptidase family protein [Clostridiales bacterium]MCI2025978.1 peptidoglycan DD-metalloendopeptidase family protein [Clostridiales bacterium]
MAGKCFWQRAAAAVITAALIVVPAATTAFAENTNVDTLRQQQSDYQNQQKENQAKIDQLKSDQTQKEAYKAALQDQVSNLQHQIDTYNQQIGDLDQDIAAKQDEIQSKQKEIDSDFALLKERLRALYISGEASNLEILLSSKSLTDLADKTEAIKMVSDHDKQLIDTLKNHLTEIEAQKAKIEQSRQEVSDAKDALDQKRTELDTVMEETQQVINELAGSAEALEEQNKEIAQKEAATAEQIDSWYANYYSQKQSSSDVVVMSSGGGQFVWPVPYTTNVTSGFGPRWGTNHKGIDISSGGVYGQPIVASASGTVIVADAGGWGGGYGTWVSIDHGNGFSTVYGHMSSLCVSVGQAVQQGQVIGYVGSTGDSTGPHCHFEVRVNGVAQDPLNYV